MAGSSEARRPEYNHNFPPCQFVLVLIKGAVDCGASNAGHRYCPNYSRRLIIFFFSSIGLD